MRYTPKLVLTTLLKSTTTQACAVHSSRPFCTLTRLSQKQQSFKDRPFAQHTHNSICTTHKQLFAKNLLTIENAKELFQNFKKQTAVSKSGSLPFRTQTKQHKTTKPTSSTSKTAIQQMDFSVFFGHFVSLLILLQ